jgi:hypothetical protein
MRFVASLAGLVALVSAGSIAHAQVPAQPGQGLEAGGLTPPSSAPEEPPPPPGETEQQLAQADREDSGRGLEYFLLNGEVGFEHIGLRTLSDDGLVDADNVPTTQTGAVYGGGIGLRLVFVTGGVRFRFGNFSDWQMWTLNGEVGVRIPYGNLEPYAALGAGYASVGGVQAGDADVDISGWNVRAAAGLDWYLSNTFSVGANLSGDLLLLSRAAIGGAPSDSGYASDGSSVGSGVTLTAVAGMHF